MVALFQSVPVLASVLGADDIVSINSANREALFLDDVVLLTTKARGQQLLKKIEGFRYQQIHFCIQRQSEVFKLLHAHISKTLTNLETLPLARIIGQN